MIKEDKITIDVKRSTPPAVQISSTRGVSVSQFLRGKSVSEAITVLPMIYSVCGMAHASAAIEACSPINHEGTKAKIARELVVLCENAREHCLRIFTGWGAEYPDLMKNIPFNQVMMLVPNMKALVSQNSDPFALNANVKIDIDGAKNLVKILDGFLSKYIFGTCNQDWCKQNKEASFVVWIKGHKTIASLFIGSIYDSKFQSLGAVTPLFLEDVPAKELVKNLHEKKDFSLQPEWQGQAHETGAMARWHNHKLLQDITQKYGVGLLARHVARLVELAYIPKQIALLLDTLKDSDKQHMPITLDGFGQVETARGRLVHSVKIRGGRIHDYKILAPTEWNFHDNGVVVSSLKAISDNDNFLEKAKMIVEAIDPCVDFEVRVA